LSRWNAVTMPQYKGSATSREPSNFQNHIHFLAHYFPGPTTIQLMGWYANFYKDNVNTRIDKRYSLTDSLDINLRCGGFSRLVEHSL
jgi:hypothetical protein